MKKLIWMDPLFYSGLLLSFSIVMQDVAYALKDGFGVDDLAYISRAVAVQLITTLALLSERRHIVSSDKHHTNPSDLSEDAERKIFELYQRKIKE